VSQQVADRRDFRPGLFCKFDFQFVWNASARLRNDLDTSLYGAAKLVVTPLTRKINTRHHLTNRVDGFENVTQADKMRSLDHSNNPYRFGFDLRP
jgi:hypothetical protein